MLQKKQPRITRRCLFMFEIMLVTLFFLLKHPVLCIIYYITAGYKKAPNSPELKCGVR